MKTTIVGTQNSLSKNSITHGIDKASGFTVIESIIATVVIIFGLLAMAAFLGNLMSQNTTSERKTMATTIAEEKIEDLRNDALTSDVTNADNGTDTITTEAGTFVRTWAIDEDFSGLADKITVLVDWDGPGNTEITMVTLVNN